MILVFFGQPHSGKTTLSNEILNDRFEFSIDGDDLREMFSNKDFSRDGRIKNLNRASDIATFLNKKGKNVVMSLVYPIKECRDYLNSLNPNEVNWVFLKYQDERGREKNHVIDFEFPEANEKYLELDTSELSISECLEKIKELYGRSK
jgi:adenylylsulfate kinase-like enzyme